MPGQHERPCLLKTTHANAAMDLIKQESLYFRNHSGNKLWELPLTRNPPTFSNIKLTLPWESKGTRAAVCVLPAPSCLVRLSQAATQRFHFPLIQPTSRSGRQRLLL